MAIEAVKIPQNVYVEDRIVGPITLRQLIILGAGAGISFALYSTATKAGPVGVPLTIALWMPSVIAAAFAFLKINDLSLLTIILLSIEHMNKPNRRTWCPSGGISINFITSTPVKAKDEQKTAEPAKQTNISELTKELDLRARKLGELTHVPPETAQITEGEALQTHSGSRANIPTVDANRVHADALDPARSIDALSPQGLDAYDHLFRS